ncbi:nicotinamide N-methyltransferas-like protein [Eremomyces bilateralis CBS 781.70]|uniref:Nicotinamide N-methyltransferas-like protein n=1 Tax=Eremomyces bilateralis CBS 781.70 TaxID=1392243 RepID=A0A6G1GFR0_9PEZI|nr:nicotinamide N-methyltransferas-like protein [Eremomyces bilateralis CBS 781.70]KAF1816751.1 nicotinamide N-methyltransferas-like protein [Eremomyces bilateralis CBS 781.70]
MLPSLLHLSPIRPEEPESAEDIFNAGLSLFPGDVTVSHGDADMAVIYRGTSQVARERGDLKFELARVEQEHERIKFAHYLWNSSVLIAELIGSIPDYRSEPHQWGLGRWWISGDDADRWDVKGKTVLELGAGAGLAGIVGVLAGADTVTISDYPSDTLLKNIQANVERNIPPSLQSRVSVQPHLWGDFTTPFAERSRGFDRIIAADCLWIHASHKALAESMAYFLSDHPSASVCVVAGFHTGRKIVASFFDLGSSSILRPVGLDIDEIYELDVDGNRRHWDPEREEDITERKRWLVLARLRRFRIQEADL